MGRADIRIVDVNVSRILLKMDNYVFSDDAESTCGTEPNVDRGIQILDRTTYYCQFEDSRKQGLYFVWQDGYNPPIDNTFRILFRVKNPNTPSSTSLSISMFNKYSPILLKYRNMVGAYQCKSTTFGTLYPKLYIGPNLDVSSDYFPNVTLFTKGNKYDTIVFNSIRLEFKTSIDLPKLAVPNFYTIHVRIGADVQTTLPISLVYHDLPLALGKTYVYPRVATTPTITPTVFPNQDPASPPAFTTEELAFDNVAELSSRTLYTIGFKIGFQSGSSIPLVFLGDTSFCSIYITDSAGVVYVTSKAPPNVKSSFKVQPVTNIIYQNLATTPLVTHIHTIEKNDLSSAGNNYPLSYTQSPLGFAQNNPSFSPRYGMRFGPEKGLFLAFNQFSSAAGIPTGVITTKQTFLELITSQYIQAIPNIGTVYVNTPAQAQLNCFLYSSATLPVATPTEINSCLYNMMNKGLGGSEYSRFRMGGVNPSNFWNQGIFGWNRVNISRVHSIAKDGADSAILDFFINAYSDAFTSTITDYFPRGLKYTGLLNGYVFNTNQFTNTNLNYVNYVRGTAAADTLDPAKLPAFLRIGGLFNGIDTFNTRKLVIFFNNIYPLFLESDGNIEVGCATSSMAAVKCYFYQGRQSALCDGGVTCYNSIAMSRLEVLMSSTISSIADVFKVQIVVPLAIPVYSGSYYSSYSAVLGTAAQYDGSLSYFADMISWAPFNHQPTSVGAPGPFPNKIVACNTGSCNSMTGIPIVGGSGTPKSVFQPLTGPVVGALVSTKLDVNCPGSTYPQCSPVTSGTDFYSITFCTEYNFMNDATFTVPSSTGVLSGAIYESCVFNLKYKWLGKYKFCLYCPQWSNGLSTGLVSMSNFKTPSNYGLKVPASSWTAISGKVTNSVSGTNYGLFTITDQTILTGIAYSSNYLTQFSVLQKLYYTSSPATSGMNLILNFTGILANPVALGGYIKIRSTSGNLPFQFISGITSPNCQLKEYKIPCLVQGVTSTTFYIQTPIALSASTLTVVLTGLKSLLTGPLPTNTNMEMQTFTPNGMTPTDQIDLCQTPAVLQTLEFQIASVNSPVNVLKLRNIRISERVAGYRSDFYMDIILGTAKSFHDTDSLLINLQGGAYWPMDPTNTFPVTCEIIDVVSGKILPEFTVCDVSDLAAIKIETSTITPYTTFTVHLINFVVPTGSTPTVPSAQVLFKATPSTVIQATDPTDTTLVWGTITVVGVIPVVTITKKISYYGFRPDFSFDITPSVAAIAYQSRVYIQFPSQYNSGFGSFPIGCYQQTTTDPIKLYCWKYRDRTLAITGFRNTVAVGTSFRITVYGIQQPVHPSTEIEKFFIGLDNDDDPTILSEVKNTIPAGSISSIGSTVPLLSITGSEYSHKFIRAINSFLFRMVTPMGVAPGNGWSLYVYIDYLEFEYDIASFKGTCSIKLNQLSTNLASACVRQGNRYMITIGSTGLLASTEYTVLIENIPTPDFYSCRVKRPEIYLLDASSTLQAISTDIFQNTDVMTFVADPTFTYFTFNGMSTDTPLPFKKGVFNPIQVIRIDTLRFNDDFNFILGFTENNIFSQNPPSSVKIENSDFGMASLPVYLASSLNTFTNVIPVTVNFTARFNNNIFAKLPLLRAQLINTKATLNCPSTVVVWTSKTSLPFYVKLNELPLTDLLFTVTFTGSTLLTVNPSTFTMGSTSRLVKLIITSSHPSGASVETPVMNINPPAGLSGYGITPVNILLQALTLGTSTSPIVTLSVSTIYGFSVDYTGLKPVAFYSITMPTSIYRKFTLGFIQSKFDKNIFSDGKYFIDYTTAEGTYVPGVVVNANNLRSKEYYTTTFYGFDIDGATFTSTLNFSTQDSPGGYGYVNLTFASSVDATTKPALVCYMAQLFAYPLEK